MKVEDFFRIYLTHSDLSRVGREYLQVGFYTEVFFREKDVRFIAISNGVDSEHRETAEFAPLLNIMNDWYVKDTSQKITAVLKNRGMSGKVHTPNRCIYGYMKDHADKDHWIVDEEAAEIVKRIKLQQWKCKYAVPDSGGVLILFAFENII